MKKEIVQSLLNILDPLGVIEIAPKDEYENEAKKICELLQASKYADIEYCVETLYGTDFCKHTKKIQEFITLLKCLNYN